MIGLNVSDGIRVATARSPERAALIDGSRSLSFARLLERSARVANAVIGDLNLPAGSRVAILAPNCLEYVELVLGCAMAGVRAVLLNARLASRELEQICQDCDARVVFGHPTLRALGAALVETNQVRLIGIGTDYEEWIGAASSTFTPRSEDGEEIFCIAPTGGTTGRSKGVRLSQRSRVLMYLAMASAYGCYGPDDRNLTVSPLFHGSGFNFCFATLFGGGSVTLMNHFDPEHMLELLVKEQITNASVVPTHLTALFGIGEARLRAADTVSLKALISNGAPLPVSMKEMGSSLWNNRALYEAYGSTEAGIIATIVPSELLKRPESVGKLFPLTLAQLRTSDAALVAPGEMGELFTESPYLFSGYENRGSEPPRARHSFTAGDLGRFDEDGFLYLVDRKDEKIISGGVNVFPNEVELVLADHPAIREVAVFGIPDPYWGEAVHALVALKAGASASPEELLAYARVRLGGVKTPKSLELRSELPKSAAGKILRRVLRDEYRERAAAARAVTGEASD